jgi:acyl transferase domain-containing protein
MLLKEFYEECKILPAELSYVETHGTGTVAGDSVEIASIDKALYAKRTSSLLIGSVKSNLGYSEASSSLCQMSMVN